MKLQEITIDHEKLFFPVLGDRGQGKKKEKLPNYCIRRSTSQEKLENTETEQSVHTCTR